MTYTQNDLDNRWLHKYNISFSFSQNKSVKIQESSFVKYEFARNHEKAQKDKTQERFCRINDG